MCRIKYLSDIDTRCIQQYLCLKKMNKSATIDRKLLLPSSPALTGGAATPIDFASYNQQGDTTPVTYKNPDNDNPNTNKKYL